VPSGMRCRPTDPVVDSVWRPEICLPSTRSG
jgi:hypothetical protein